MDNDYVQALLRERAYRIADGDAERLADVDAELARCGHKVEAPVERATARPGEKRSVRRRTDA